MDYVTLDLTYSKDESEYFGEDATICVGYLFRPGRPATYWDPPEPAEVEILEITKELDDGSRVYYSIEDIPDKLYETLSDMIIDVEEENNMF